MTPRIARAARRRAQASFDARPPRGLSLIEILVALAIAALLLLGLSQIFIGSKQAYSVQNAVSRSQENARFILGFLESNVRMAGYYGCGNESSIGSNFYNHLALAAANPEFKDRFQRPIEGFKNNDCALGGTCSLPADPVAGARANWTPNVSTTAWPPTMTATAPAPVKSSDILVLRVLSSQSYPTVGLFNPSATPGAGTPTFSISTPLATDANFIQPTGTYAIANCAPRVDIFRATTGSGGTAMVAASGGSDNILLNPTNPADTSTWAWTQAEGVYRQPPNGQLATTINGELYKAQYMAFYVGIRPGSSPPAPALYVQQPPPLNAQEIADGVENMQITYGVDTSVPPDGVADAFVSANTVDGGAADEATRDANWRRVVSVHIALLMRAQDRAGVQTNAAGNVFVVNGNTRITAPTTPDGRYRDVYETTIALRNRLSNF